MHGTNVVQSTMLTIDNMDRKYLTITKKDERQKFEPEVFGRAAAVAAASVSITGAVLHLSTKYHMQKKILNIGSTSKVKTGYGVIDLRESGIKKNSVSSLRSSNNMLTVMPQSSCMAIDNISQKRRGQYLLL